jgi:putative transcriptional regulator
VVIKSYRNQRPLFERLKSSLEDANRHAKGEITLKTTTVELPDKPPEVDADDVVRIRLDNQMSQAVFARVLNVSPKTVQSWEQGSRKPSHASLRLIQVIRKNPQVVLQTVGMAAPVKKRVANTKADRNR